MNMKVCLALLIVFAAHPAARAGIFGEGFSSAEPGTPSAVYYRAFTIYTRQEACEKSIRPVELRISPDPIYMKIGDRVHHSGLNGRPSDLVIQAYDAQGSFLPSLPIVVDVIGKDHVTDSRSDWDYFEAVAEGEDELRASWACATSGGQPVEARVRILVTAEGASEVSGDDTEVERDSE